MIAVKRTIQNRAIRVLCELPERNFLRHHLRLFAGIRRKLKPVVLRNLLIAQKDAIHAHTTTNP